MQFHTSVAARLGTHYQTIVGIGDICNVFIVLGLNLYVLLADIGECLIVTAFGHGRNGV